MHHERYFVEECNLSSYHAKKYKKEKMKTFPTYFIRSVYFVRTIEENNANGKTFFILIPHFLFNYSLFHSGSLILVFLFIFKQ